MQKVRHRIGVIVITMALVFSVAVPVPSGIDMLDDIRYEDAYANPAAGAAVYPVLATILAAAGIYVVGATTGAYDANLEDIYELLSDKVPNNYGLDAALLATRTATGGVVLGALDPTLWSVINDVVAEQMAVGNMLTGSNSNPGVTQYSMNGFRFYKNASLPSWFNVDSTSIPAGYTFVGYSVTANGVWSFHFSDSTILPVYSNGTAALSLRLKHKYFNFQEQDGSMILTYDSGSPRTTAWNCVDNATFFVPTVTFSNILHPIESGTVAEDAIAVVNQGLLDAAPTSNASYQVFNPTAEQLQDGYSISDLQSAIYANTGVATDTLSGVNGIIGQLDSVFGALQGLGAAVNGISTSFTSMASTPFGWLSNWWDSLTGWWSQLLTWVGSTPFGNVMGTVIDGIGGLKDAAWEGLLDVGEAVTAIPGAIEGYIEGVLEAINAGVLSLEAALDAIASAIASEMAGVLEGLQFPIRFPELPQFNGSGSVALPPGMGNGLTDSLAERVPFCYLVRSKDAVGRMFANFGSNRSFYFDLNVPFASEPLHFDGEIFLSRSFGSLDIASVIRVLATSMLCLGLLFRAYKIIERKSF